MKNGWKRTLAVLMALTMVLVLLPVNAWAVEPEEDEPVVYADETENEAVVVYETEEDAVAAVREELKRRQERFYIYIDTERGIEVKGESTWNNLLSLAWAHTGNPTEGDYIRLQCSGYGGQDAPNTTIINGHTTRKISFSMWYCDTLDQEKLLDNKINEVLTELDIDDKDDYTKIQAIYDYICTHVEYDSEAYWLDSNDPDAWLARSAYAALINGRALCQGYANLLYRMMLEVGIDSRIILGTHSGEGHGWNIVKIGDVYYNLDVTEDAKYDVNHHGNFLECDEWFSFGASHNRGTYYTSDEFQNAYPMATKNYVAVTGISMNPALKFDQGNEQTLTVGLLPEDATNQKIMFSSSNPDVATVDASGKVTAIKEGKSTITAITEVGGLTATCTVEVQHKHTPVYHATRAGTCVAKAVKEYWSCAGCNELFSNVECTVPTTKAELETEIDPTNHVGAMEQRGAKAPTCKKEGHEADTYCTACNTLVIHGATIEKAPHDLTKHDAQQGTCTMAGSIAYWACATCGELFRDAQGTVKTNLDDVKTDKDTTNHAGGQEVRNVKQVTCSADGYTGDTYCLGCNAKIADGAKIDKLAHALVAHDAKQATCKDKGNDAYWECTTCGGLFSNAQGTVSTTLEAVSKPQDSENHAANTKLVGKKDATCTENGYTGDKVCADCGAVLTKGTATDKSAHQLTHVAARTATCKESGNIEYWKCESCGGLFRDGDGKNEVKAVMTVDGNNHVGGTELRNEKAATCTAEGYTGDKYCLSCGEKVAAGTVTSKVSHELTRHEAVAATHSAAGSIAYWSCAACSGLFSDAAGKQPITAQETVIPATEQKADTEHWAFDGAQHWNVCTDCGAQMNAAAHTFGNWTTQKEATASATGIKARACTICGYREQAEIPVLTAAETAKPSTAKKPETESQAKTENQKSPRTADNSMAVLGMAALALAASGVLVTAVVRKRRMK